MTTPDAHDATLHIIFDGLKMIVGTPIHVSVDGADLGAHSFNEGFHITHPCAPGTHAVVIRIANLRTRAYTVVIPSPGEHTMRLSYSRIWGNFKRAYALA